MEYSFASRDGHAEDLDALFNADMLAFDVEASGTHTYADVPLGFSVTDGPDHSYFAHIDNAYFRELMANPNTLYIAHNAKYDRSKMKQAGIVIDNLCDTMIAAHLCEEPRLSLHELVERKLNRSIKTFGDYPKPVATSTTRELVDHFGSHARATWILWNGFQDEDVNWPGYKYELRRRILWDTFWKLEMPLIPVISDMEMNGVQIDADYLLELGKYYNAKISLLEDVLANMTNTKGVNFNSPDQVAHIFYDKLGIKPPWRKTRSKRPAVDGKYLESIKNTHPVIPVYLLYKQYQKLKSTYVSSIVSALVNGRLYGSFNQTGTRTGRLSSSGPNLQNIPQREEEGRKIRRAFVAPEGCYLVKADADQLELKMMAHWSQDPYMLNAFRSGRDIHLETALRAFGDPKMRPKAKTLNFQIQYGGGTQADKDAFYGAYPIVLQWTKKTQQEAKELGYVRTLFKRKRSIPEIREPGKMGEHGEREAISTIIQGSSAEVVKVGMRRIWEDVRDSEIKMVLQVHDELVFECPESIVYDFMDHLKKRLQYDELSIPITYSVSYGRNWAEMEKWKPN